MKILTAETAGFCFGVQRALNIVKDLLEKGEKVCTFGELIHNPDVVETLKKQGVDVVHSLFEAKEGSTLVIRSHGATLQTYNDLKRHKVNYIDATCPFVKKIHKIVQENSEESDFLLIAGNSTHPEMVGIRSYFSKASYPFEDVQDIKNILMNYPELCNKRGLVVSQTTFSKEKWIKCIKFIKNSFTNVKIYDSICTITISRQKEAEKLSKISDAMIVVGGEKSSNTTKLCEICRKNGPTFLVQNRKNISFKDIGQFKCIGITAGASTPFETVEEIKKYITKAQCVNKFKKKDES